MKINDKKDFRRKILKMALYFVLFFALYQMIIRLGETYRIVYYVGISVYLAVASVLFCVYYAKNGFRLNTAPTPYEDLPSEWTKEKKEIFSAEEKAKTEDAKKILTVLLPMVVTILFNYIAMYSENIYNCLKELLS